MTVYSQNGYSACVPSTLARFPVPGTGLEVVMRIGPVSTVLLYWAQLWDAHVEPIRMAGCYACRSVRGYPGVWSNHASGTALDLDWDVHPLGATPSATMTARVHALLDTKVNGIRIGSVLRWGGDYISRKDSMHTEINAAPAAVSALAAAIKAQHPPVPVEVDDVGYKIINDGAQHSFLTNGMTQRWIKHNADLALVQYWMTHYWKCSAADTANVTLTPSEVLAIGGVIIGDNPYVPAA